MTGCKDIALGLVVAGAVLLPADGGRGAVLDVPPGADHLAAAVARAAPGDTLRLAAGLHAGPIVVERRLVLEGEPGAVVDGGGRGRVITLSAAGAVVRGLTVRNSGRSLATMDAGIFVDKAGDDALVEDNHIEDTLFGVYLWGPERATVSGNRIDGIRDMRVNERGNGVQLWNTPGSVIAGNVIRHGRDGIFTTTSRRNVFSGNRFENTRIAVHYMYTNDSEVSDNVSVGNHVGYALMYSRRLIVRGNLSEGDRDHGILLNYANRSRIQGNVVRRGGTKCVFIYNSSRNLFSGNRFEACPVGIHFTAGSERNTVTGNAFVGNRSQVKYVGTRWLDWSSGGRGNYWSDNPAFDLDGDGIADTAYRPNDMVDRVVWANPLAKVLLNSPSLQVLRWAQSQFPALHPGGVVDSAPLMRPPEVRLAARAEDSHERPDH